MSNQQSSYTSFSSTSYTTSSSSSDGVPHTKSYSETANYDSRTGGNIVRESRESGQPTLREHREVPVQGQARVQSGGGSLGSQRRIEDVTDKDQEYLDRMEDEYAKRDGGA